MNNKEEQLQAVGSRLNPLSVISIGVLVVFILMIFCLIMADILYLVNKDLTTSELWSLFTTKDVINALKLSVTTSLVTLLLVILSAVPIGYALSRYKLPFQSIINTVVDVPIVLPPVVIGVSLLAFFGFGIGSSVKTALKAADISLISWVGIVICQYLISVSYCIRSIKTAFDRVELKLEHVAYTLGCSQWQAFWKISLPLAKNGVIAGSIMAWARGIGVFGPLMVFVGTSPRVQVMPTAMWLELSIGNIEVSLALALIMLVMAGSALSVVHFISPGRDII